MKFLWALLLIPVGLTVALDVVAWKELGPQPLAPKEPLPQVGSLSAERCGICHVDIKREWAESRHAAAITDPLYGADLKHQGEPYFCNHCHAPLAEQQPAITKAVALAWPKLIPVQGENPRYDAKLHLEGVTCVACHQDGDAMRGPRETKISPHPVKVDATFRSEALCEGCHTLAMTKLGSFQRPLMETVNEWRAYRAAGGDKVCVDCHLPGKSHRLRGPTDLEFVRTAIEVVKVEGTRVTVKNGTGHRLPTAEPHRRVEVALELFDATGVVGRSVARIERKLDLEKLKEEPGQDTTLLAREERVIALAVPQTQRPATGARVVVDFWLWEPEDLIAVAAGLKRESLVHRLHEQEISLP